MLSNSHIFRSLSLSVSAVLLFACVARGQILNVTDTTSTPIPGAGHDYIKMLSETVNPANGSASIRIQTPVPPGRRLTIPFAFAYDSNGVHFPQQWPGNQIGWASNTSFLSNGGWSYPVPMLSDVPMAQSATVVTGGVGFTYTCQYSTGFVFQDGSGGRHSLGFGYITYSSYPGGGQPAGCAYFDISPAAVNWHIDPQFGATMEGTGGGGPPFLVFDNDGTAYHFLNDPINAEASPTGGAAELPDFVEDRNGNKISFTDLKGGAFTAVDTLGRTVVSSSGFGTTGNTVSIAGLSEPYTVTWGSTSYSYNVGGTLLQGDSGCPGFPGLGSGTHPLPVISSITLPNNQTYTFLYDSTYGLLNKIIYPNGGYVRYVWGINPQSEWGAFADIYSNPTACIYHYGTPAVLNRFVSFNGSTEVLEQDFTYSTTWNGELSWTQKKTIVTTRDKLRGGSFQTTYLYSPIGAPWTPYAPITQLGNATEQIPVEQTVTYGDWNGTTARTEAETWWGDPYRVACRQTILGSSSPSSMELFYYAAGVQLAEKDEYDFGTACPSSNPQPAPTASLLRKTVISYQAFGNTPLFTSTYYPAGAPISDRPTSVTICSPSGTGPACPASGGGAQVSQTTYVYDGASLAASGVQTGHDSSYSTSTNIRGNATSKSEWVSTSGQPLTWDYTYDDTGQQVSMADPKGNETQYSYADDFPACGPSPGSTNAYLTEIKDAKEFTQTFAYRYCDGQLVLAKDRNGQPTSYSYADSLNRLTQVSYPDTGQTNYTYSTACGQPSTTTILLGGSSDYTESATMDGVCHVTRNTITSDPAGDDYTDTAYDGSGRVWTFSNSYRSSSDPTYGLTTTTYDALGRTTQVAYQDGSVATTSYTGKTWTVTDPAGKTRTLQSDALGRLVSVAETSINPNYSTSYSYNALDDLLTVSQGGQTRTFSYDSLSRLTSATNPESGLTSYTYPTSSGSGICSGDASSPCTRTDARGITTTYLYADSLNRLTSKMYSDGTPAATFFYDETMVTLGFWTSPGLNYPNGRLTHTATRSLTLQTATVQDYDKMGRTQDYWQCTPYNCGTTSIWYGYYHYDLAGDNDWWIHPGGFTITNTISPARQITAIQSSWVDSNHPQYPAQSISYTPWGAPSELVNGCAGSGCTNAQETYQYNKRLQPWVNELATTTQDYCLVYNYYSSWTPPSSCPTPGTVAPTGSTNNGDVMGYWDQDSVNPSTFSHTASYTYDGVNRLWTATAKTLAGSTIWSQTYSYDQWGNGSCSGTGLCASVTYNNHNNNQLATIGNYSFQYDAAGNLTQDPSNYPLQPVHYYQWDAEGRVASVDGGSTWSFTYNALGHRVQWAYTGGADQHLFDPEGNWLGVAGSYSLVRFGSHHMLAYLSTDTVFNHVNQLDATTMGTNHSGTAVEDVLFYPWGDQWQSSASGYSWAMPYRDLKTTTDITTARFSSPNFGRWLSPDPLGGQLIDPQTLNKYAYVRNNPTTLTDPSGLDFGAFFTCGEESDQCHNGLQGQWKQEDDALWNFQTTVIHSGAGGSLTDQSGNSYTGTFNGQDVTFSNAEGQQSAGSWIQGSNPTTLGGSGLFQGFTGVFNGNCGGTCVASGSIFGTATQFATLESQMLHNPGMDAVDLFHHTFFGFGPQNYRNGNLAGPDPHLVSRGGTEQAGYDQFHYDSSYPYATVPGFFSHAGSVLRSIGRFFTGAQELPPPTTIP